MTHIREKCVKYPGQARVDKIQKILSYQPVKNKEPCNLVSMTYSVEACKEAIARLIIKDKMSFRVVKGEEFREMLWVSENKFKVPSRIIVARDILQLHKKKKLIDFFVSSHQRVSLTTNIWISTQNRCYMSYNSLY